MSKYVEELDTMIGIENVKEEIRNIQKFAKFVKKSNSLDKFNFNTVFHGPFGSGKKTVAKILTGILYEEGIIRDNKIVFVGPGSLITEENELTIEQINKIVDNANGGVIYFELMNFTYRLSRRLIAAALEKQKKGNLIIFCSGASWSMHEIVKEVRMIPYNFSHFLEFPEYTKDELYAMFENKASDIGYSISEEAKEKITDICRFYRATTDFGNGKFINKLFQIVLEKNFLNGNNKTKKINEKDIPTVKEIGEYFDKYYIENGKELKFISEYDKKQTAYHEMGHAIVAATWPEWYIKNVNVLGLNDGNRGAVTFDQEESVFSGYKTRIRHCIRRSLAGMAAGKITSGKFTDGNRDDLNQAKNGAFTLINMGESSLGFKGCLLNDSRTDNRMVDEASKILSEEFENACKVLEKNRDILDKAAEVLYEKQYLEADELKELLKDVKDITEEEEARVSERSEE